MRSDDPDVAVMMEQISKTVHLPADERPTIAIVTDMTKLEQSEFLKLAQNGDRVVIYSEAGKAYLYRPSTQALIGETTVTTKP